MQKSQRKKKNLLKQYAKYSSLTIQMGVFVYASTYLGDYVDVRLKTEKSIFTIIFSVCSIAGSLYYVFKRITNE